jgi:diguanylate cyclase (GGDEF)-like protein/PAS domain S-box-containing protein
MEKTRILVVEDEVIIAQDLKMRLQKMGYNVPLMVATGEDAIEKTREINPDIILMDIMLIGQMDGIEAGRQIRERYYVPVIYLTAYADESMINRAKLTEASGYLMKPVAEKELHSTIEMALYKHKTEKKLKESEGRFRGLVEATTDWIWEVNDKYVYTYVSPKVLDILGYEPAEVIGKTPFDFMLPEESRRVSKAIKPFMDKHKPFHELENKNIHKDGRLVVLESSGIPVFSDQGAFCGYRGIDRDITERKESENKLVHAKEEWEQTFDTLPDIILVIDNNNIIKRANKATAEKLGIKREDLIGKTCYNVMHGTDEPPPHCPHSKTKQDGKEHIEECYANNLNGYYLLSATPLFDSDGRRVGVLEVARDITARKTMEEKLRATAITDELTGLLNRRGFFTLAEQQRKLSDRSKRSISLMYLDLDGMKNINDELGHTEGDRALTDTASILKNSLRESDIIARIGGDEFAVLLTDTTEPDIEKTIIRHIQHNTMKHNNSKGRKYELILSIGMYRYNPDTPCSIYDLLKRADESMYKDKQRHKLEKGVTPLLKEDNVDRRVFKRFKTGDHCWAELDISGKVKVKDISIGGARLNTPQPLTSHTLYKIKIYPSDNEEIALTGVVAWSSRIGYEMGKDVKFPYEAGLKFIELSENLKSSLDKFTENISS